MTKMCNKCEQQKEFTEFFKDKNNKTDGHYSICKTCKQIKTVQWRNENRSRYNENMRKYHAKHYTKFRLSRYKMTPEQHAKMLADQNHVCAICHQPPRGKHPLAVDHRHSDGKLRGLLCYGCNRALHILESIPLLEAAVEYLKKYEK